MDFDYEGYDQDQTDKEILKYISTEGDPSSVRRRINLRIQIAFWYRMKFNVDIYKALKMLRKRVRYLKTPKYIRKWAEITKGL